MKEGGSTRGGMKKARKVRKQSVQGSRVRTRWWRNEMGKEDRGHCGEKEFWINIRRAFSLVLLLITLLLQTKISRGRQGTPTSPCPKPL